ncbi:hypothetical protein ISG33_04825 [Glaciecola sp. MH2013]|uniref:hypothetical protein n=1 Tax=Glaciecola sp. MH2013 TaxID=2785524 RepID=UPI00189FED61|nr:hypothetical protein [Glaciecola sp. MH2013]MBF7072722.1 hypothetical protein [Glaciecola sp. MH2013]
MDKIASQYIQQELKLARSAHSATPNKSLFYLYLSMHEQVQAQEIRFPILEEGQGSGNAKASLDIENNHYRHPALVINNKDFSRQQEYTTAIEHGSVSTLRLLAAMHPQSLSYTNNAFAIDDAVIENASLRAQRTMLRKNLNSEDGNLHAENDLVIESQATPTQLFELIPKANTFSQSL